MENKNISGYFAAAKPLLKTQKLKTKTVVENAASLQDCLNRIPAGEYLAAVWQVNELKLGYYQNGSFKFAAGSEVEEKYLLELRIFNDEYEVYIVKTGSGYKMRIICDNTDDGNLTTVTDSTSDMFGSRCEADLPEGFALVKEPGRKISIVVPCGQKADKYAVTTRSYVTYDKSTGLAGYGYYRWLAIAPAEGR